MLKAKKVSDFMRYWWDAKAYRPDGIVSGLDTWDMLQEQKDIKSIPYPWACLNEYTLRVQTTGTGYDNVRVGHG